MKRWRAPLLAAVAVILVAGVTVTIATLGSDDGQVASPGAPDGDQSSDTSVGVRADGLVFAHQPNPNGGDAALLEGTVMKANGCLAVAADGFVTVPVFPVPSSDPSALNIGDRVALGGSRADQQPTGTVIPDQCLQAGETVDGFFIAWSMEVFLPAQPEDDQSHSDIPPVSVAPTTAVAPGDAGPVTVDVNTVWAGTARQQFVINLLPHGILEVSGDDTDADFSGASDSDVSPLGYLRVAGSTAELPFADDAGGWYMYGVVGPAVDRIAVLTTDADDANPADLDSARLMWVVADTSDHIANGSRGARILWTDIADGWRAFALQTDAPSPVLTAIAVGADRSLLQVRQYTPSGDVYDLPVGDAPEVDVWDDAGPEPRFGPDRPNGAAGPYVATYPDRPDGNYHDALLEGTVTVVDGCVVAEADFGGDFTLIFPQSQIEPAEPPAVVEFNGTEYRDGDRIAVGGAETSLTADNASVTCPGLAWGVSPE